MSNRLVISLILLIVTVITVAPIQKRWDDGVVLLSVTVISASCSPIQSVSCEAFSSEESAQSMLEYLLPPETRLYSAFMEVFKGEPIQVGIPISYTTNAALLWSHTKYFQMKFLVVIVKYKDGRREGQLVNIPDVRVIKSLRVEFP